MPHMEEIQHPETIDGLMNMPRQSSSGGDLEAHTFADNLMSSSSQSTVQSEVVAKKAAPKKEAAHLKEEPAKAKTDVKKAHKKKKLLKKAKKHLKKKKKSSYGKASHVFDRYPGIFSDLLQIVKIRPILDGMMKEMTGGGDKGGKSAAPQKPPWEDFSMEKAMKEAEMKKKMKKKIKPLNILSYGTGDATECMTLRKYFPNATIHGVDYDEELTAKNRAENDDPRIQFYSTPESLKQGWYDVVLGLDFLCSQNSWGPPLAFDEWESRVAVMDFLLKPGGYLVTYNSNYPMNLFSKADSYEAQVMSCEQGLSPATKVLDMKSNDDPHDWNVGLCAPWAKYCRESGWRPKYDKEGKILQQMGGGGASFGCLFPGTVFRKTGPKKGQEGTP